MDTPEPCICPVSSHPRQNLESLSAMANGFLLKGIVMAVKHLKPTSAGAGRRSRTSPRSPAPSPRSLFSSLPKKAGRNNNGRITTRHQGGGVKRRYRAIDFAQQGWRARQGCHDRVRSEPFRSHRSAALRGRREALHPGPQGLKVGDTVISGAGADIKPGNALPSPTSPSVRFIHAVEFQPGKGAAIARSAGTACQLMGKEGKYAIIRMPSSEMRRVLVTCRASIGEVGNSEHSTSSSARPAASVT